MHLEKKTTILFAQFSNLSGSVASGSVLGSSTASGVGTNLFQSFNKMDLVVNVSSLAGTTASISFDVFEQISGLFVLAANSGTFSTTGTKTVLYRDTGNSLLGKGADKQVRLNLVASQGGSVGAMTADVYFVLWN